jgi:dipeptidyl aminopeptidase/acylaminoacyl peptidase
VNDDLLDRFVDGNDVTGELQVPLLTLHSTGDGQVPIEQARILRRRVDAAGKGDLLVQRVIADASHAPAMPPNRKPVGRSSWIR